MASIIEKSSRHTKIIGQFGELFVANLLSRSGFEVIFADHVGFDLISYRADKGRMGISVKSRTRGRPGGEQEAVNLFSLQDDKLEASCQDFGLIPWIAVYVETPGSADLYLTSLDNYKAKHQDGQKMLVWNMRQNHQATYAQDEKVMHFRMTFCQNNWFSESVSETMPGVASDG